MSTNAKLCLAAAACLAVGYMASETRFDPANPFSPAPIKRPILNLVRKAARLGLWVAVFAEPQPQSPERAYTAMRLDCPPNGTVCHREGW